jgi:hypothetical protein
MKLKVVIASLLGIILTLFFYIWYLSKKETIEKITATDIETTLKKSDNPIYPSGIAEYLPDDVSKYFTKYYKTYTPDNGLHISESENGFYSITSDNTGFLYQIKVKEDNGAVFFQITNHFLPNSYLKKIVSSLIEDQRFILKESDTKYGMDHLIKEFSDYYVVVHIIPNSARSDPSSLTIETYSK